MGRLWILFNMCPDFFKPGLIQRSIVLRLDMYSANNSFPMNLTTTDYTYYHGGWLIDEMAALVSLCMGIRLKAGEFIREFIPNSRDPFGRPFTSRYKLDPVVNIRTRGLVLPRVGDTRTGCNLTKIEPIKSLPNLTGKEAIALIRAARLYQDALWIAESDPSSAWVMFVSALECAANQWQISNESPLEMLKNSKPGLIKILEETGIKDLPEKVAKEIKNNLGVTKKFINFILEFQPPPPDKRPIEWAQIDWSKDSFKKYLNKIYNYRSIALHDGVPFPVPMCYSPLSFIDNEMQYFEKPCAISFQASGGKWMSKDVPMLLHTFEYITRGVLLNWWNSMNEKSNKL